MVENIFMDKYLCGRTNYTSLGQILQTIDSEIDKEARCHQSSEATATTGTAQPSQELIKEIESLRAENDALKAQLSLEIQQLKQENLSLKQKLHQVSTKHPAVTVPEPQYQKSRTTNCEPESSNDPLSLPDATVKRFNSLPKTLTEFFEQMKNGCEDFPKFTEISDDLRKCKRTKASYCKGKAIYAFITSYCGGAEACLDKFKSFTPLQLYEQHIKKSRAQSTSR